MPQIFWKRNKLIISNTIKKFKTWTENTCSRSVKIQFDAVITLFVSKKKLISQLKFIWLYEWISPIQLNSVSGSMLTLFFAMEELSFIWKSWMKMLWVKCMTLYRIVTKIFVGTVNWMKMNIAKKIINFFLTVRSGQ